jgi:trichoplein keratin filament-binding protein|mmetsp:Transcript_11405/g.20977  ORF Transcript_11405/g.20977 Transcript_11405/m.20977 type:complete len:491 (-) Transcript_11405:391-1863(-)
MHAKRMFPPDRMITQRRREEEVRGALTQKVEAELNDKKFAEWVNNTHDKILHRRKLEVVDEFTQAHQRTVEERRERLQALLVAEQEEYFKALDNMVETQDQRKQRLATHALELKQHRESKRQEIAKSKMDQAFRENCDVLRGAITRQNTLQVAVQRQQQLEWQEARKHERQEDERIFDEMWEQERLKKVQRAVDDMERAHKMNMALRTQLKAQKDAYDQVKERERQMRAEEDRLYKEQVEFQLQYDAQKEKERRAAAVAMGYANREFNAMLRAEKEKKMKEKKEEDIRQLQELLDQIRAAEEEEQMAKVARREDTKRYMEALREAMGQDADNEAEMERLWQQENEKAWAKREAQWAKDQDARDNLLRQVFEERSRQLEAKQNIIHEERAQRKRDKEQLLEQMEAAAQVERQKAEAHRQQVVEAQDDLKTQIEGRRQFKETQKNNQAMERIAAEQAEEEFKRKVQQELDAVNSRRPNQFRGMRTATAAPNF